MWLNRHWTSSALLGASLFVIGAQVWMAPHYGWWLDEIFSLWASDPHGPLERLTSDTNPPIYFLLLRAARLLFEDERLAVLFVSALSLIVAAWLVVWTGRRGSRGGLGALVVLLFVGTGVTQIFFQEARPFLLASCIGLVATWLAVLLVERSPPPRPILLLSVIGVASGLTHFYAALLTGCLGAALVAYALMGRRPDLTRPGLILGGVSAAVFGLWFLIAADRAERIGWIVFSFDEVRGAFWMVRALTIGPAALMAPLAVLAAVGAMRAGIRPHFIVLGLAGALFLAIPLAISFQLPIVVGRYWCVGAALISTPLALLIHEFSRNATVRERGALAACILCAVAAAASGLATARRLLQEEATWSFAPLVGRLANECGPASIAVPIWPELYATAAELDETVFVEAARRSPEDAASACPVIGWTEHLYGDDRPSPDRRDAELLATLGLDSAAGSALVERSASGFVVLRPGVGAQRRAADQR